MRAGKVGKKKASAEVGHWSLVRIRQVGVSIIQDGRLAVVSTEKVGDPTSAPVQAPR